MKRKFIKPWLSFVFVVLLTFFLLEVFSKIAVNFSSLKPEKTFQEIYQNRLGTREAYDRISHPYFAFTKKTQQPRYYDFDPPYFFPFPTAIRPRVVVGILGGSVADNFYDDTVASNRGGSLKDALQKVPRFRNKDIVILNGALPAGKQPQQFSLAAHYLDIFDVTINIDGFNEITTDNFPEFPFEYPSFAGNLFPKNTGFADLYFTARAARLINEISTSLPLVVPWLNKSAAYYLGWYAWDRYSDALIKRKNKEALALKNSETAYYQGDILPDERIRILADIWGKFSLRQSQLYEANHKETYFFLQPNLHLAGTKPMTAEELVMITEGMKGGDKERYEKPVQTGYPHLLEQLKMLQHKGVKVEDLTEIFSKTKQTLYIDSCCHFNANGNRIMLNSIAKKLQDRK